MPPIRPLSLAVLAALAFNLGQSICLAIPSYSLKEVKVSGGAYAVFDAQGQVAPETVTLEDGIRIQSGPYSITNQDIRWHNVDYIHRSFSRLNGQADLPIEPTTYYETTYGLSVNSHGTYVGYENISQSNQAISFTRDGGTKLVATPYDGISQAYSINDAGQIVGAMTYNNGHYVTAFLTEGQNSWDLNTLLGPGNERWLLTSATDINSKGQILAQATDRSDPTYRASLHYVLLTPDPTPTPEPSTLVLLAIGSGIGLQVRRRRRETGSA